MHKTNIKGVFREIKGSLNRYLSIMVIVMIGVSFYAGLKSVGPDMQKSASRYFGKNAFMDYRLLSSIGFDSDDVSAVRAASGIGSVETVYSMDALQTDGDQTNVAHLISLPKSNYDVNQLNVLDGRLPQADNECVVDKQKIGKTPKIGDTVTLSSGNDTDIGGDLKVTAFQVVGIVESPQYLTRDRGTTKLGNGKVNNLLYIPEQDFTLPAYTELWVTAAGTKGLNAFYKAYSEKLQPLETALNGIAGTRTQVRHQEMLDDANAQLNEKQSDYDSAKAESDQKIADAQAKIDDSTKHLSDARQQLNSKKQESEQRLSDQQSQLDDAKKQLDGQTAQYNEKLAQYNQASASAAPQFASAQKQIDVMNAQIANLKNQESTLQQQIDAGKTSGTLTQEQISQMSAQIQSLQNNISALTQQEESAQSQLVAQQKQLADTKAQLDSAKAALDASEAQLSDKQSQLNTAKTQAEAQFTEGEQKLDSQSDSLKAAQQDLDTQKNEAEQKLGDAAQQLNNARQKVSDLQAPEWHVLSRDANSGYVDFKGSIDRTSGIAGLLPIFFFAIAALVCLTTMTRMVNEQRSQIGTLKALGYGGGSIAFKYLFYAASASILGAVLGWAIGFTVFPSVIFRAYKSLYTMPAMKAAFHPTIALLSGFVAVAVTTAAVLFTCISELRAVPSALMRPQAPKPGKRIILERLTFLWKRLKFSQKVTARNLFRYKKRFWMTVLGVACCCAMLVAGFGLRDSMATQVSEKEFGEILKYDMTVGLKDSVSADQYKAITDALSAHSEITSFMMNTTKGITARNGAESESCILSVPSQPDKLPNYFVLRDPGTQKPITLTDDGAVLTQKLADMLHVKVGDTVKVEDDETHSHSFRVEGIAENYLQHYIFLSPAAYKTAYGAEPVQNQIMATLKPSSDQNGLSTALMKTDGVSSVRFTSDNKQDFQNMLGSINYIIWIIIISAALLAFVVLYTLTTINIGERFHEIATIKVLGFFDREVYSYITRESYLLTLFGTALGLIGGVFLHAYILSGAEVDSVMYVKSILPQSFLLSATLTFAFTWLINRIAMNALRKIDMVEALKGNE